MGYQTDFVGYLSIHPPLSEAEAEIVNRVSGSVYQMNRSTGPRVVDEVEEAISAAWAEAPRGWSNWTVCPRGCCLSYDGGDKANHMVPWLAYLMDGFLTARADPSRDRTGPGPFTRDHVLNGMVVGSRRDTGELYAIVARDNVVETELLWPGTPEWSTYPKLAYQVQIDRFRAWSVEQSRLGWPGLDRDDGSWA